MEVLAYNGRGSPSSLLAYEKQCAYERQFAYERQYAYER